jgi:hypothetical protein
MSSEELRVLIAEIQGDVRLVNEKIDHVRESFEDRLHTIKTNDIYHVQMKVDNIYRGVWFLVALILSNFALAITNIFFL